MSTSCPVHRDAAWARPTTASCKDVLVEEILDWRPTGLVTTARPCRAASRPSRRSHSRTCPMAPGPRLVHVGKTRREREEDGGPAREFLSGLITRGHAALHDVLVAEMARRRSPQPRSHPNQSRPRHWTARSESRQELADARTPHRPGGGPRNLAGRLTVVAAGVLVAALVVRRSPPHDTRRPVTVTQ